MNKLIWLLRSGAFPVYPEDRFSRRQRLFRGPRRTPPTLMFSDLVVGLLRLFRRCMDPLCGRHNHQSSALSVRFGVLFQLLDQ